MVRLAKSGFSLIALCLFVASGFSPFDRAFAQSDISSSASGGSGIDAQVQIVTHAPLWLGAEAGVVFYDRLKIYGGVGFTPDSYSETIGSVAASLGDNDAYADAIEAAFQDNRSFRFGAEYLFSGLTGWRFGAAFQSLSSSGTSDMITILEASTGNDYGNLESDENMSLDATLLIGELYAGYSWRLSSGIVLGAAFGVARLLSASTDLSTDLPFGDTAIGQNLLLQAETDLEEVLLDYGVTPTLALSAGWSF